MPYTVENELTDAGRGILELGELSAAWLGCRPVGAVAVGSEEAKKAIGALIKGWDSTILQSLAAGPRSLAELSSAIPDVSYPSLERRVAAMQTADWWKRSPGPVPGDLTQSPSGCEAPPACSRPQVAGSARTRRTLREAALLFQER
jgi:hypothetical protein